MTPSFRTAHLESFDRCCRRSLKSKPGSRRSSEGLTFAGSVLASGCLLQPGARRAFLVPEAAGWVVLPHLQAGKMVSLGALPEDILMAVLVLVPARELVRHCRLVCSLWRDVVDLPSLWKRKCQREGYGPDPPNQNISDWRTFYFLCSLKKNLIQNPCGEAGFRSWRKESNGGDRWKIETLPGDHGISFPQPHVRKYFVTSYELCIKSQLLTLKDYGYWDELMDTVRPDIVVKDWYAARFDCGCMYKLCVRLLSKDYIVVQEFLPEEVTIEQWSDAQWHELSYTFHNYPAGVRHIHFEHGGQDTQFWAGWYGIRVTSSSITLWPAVAN